MVPTLQPVDLLLFSVSREGRPVGHKMGGKNHIQDMDVSENSGFSPQIIPCLIGFSIINHPFWDTTIFLETPIYIYISFFRERQAG